MLREAFNSIEAATPEDSYSNSAPLMQLLPEPEDNETTRRPIRIAPTSSSDNNEAATEQFEQTIRTADFGFRTARLGPPSEEDVEGLTPRSAFLERTSFPPGMLRTLSDASLSSQRTAQRPRRASSPASITTAAPSRAAAAATNQPRGGRPVASRSAAAAGRTAAPAFDTSSSSGAALSRSSSAPGFRSSAHGTNQTGSGRTAPLPQQPTRRRRTQNERPLFPEQTWRDLEKVVSDLHLVPQRDHVVRVWRSDLQGSRYTDQYRPAELAETFEIVRPAHARQRVYRNADDEYGITLELNSSLELGQLSELLERNLEAPSRSHDRRLTRSSSASNLLGAARSTVRRDAASGSSTSSSTAPRFAPPRRAQTGPLMGQSSLMKVLRSGKFFPVGVPKSLQGNLWPRNRQTPGDSAIVFYAYAPSQDAVLGRLASSTSNVNRNLTHGDQPAGLNTTVLHLVLQRYGGASNL
ncbi:unnamed protein product [Amoebophrya sp. A120]|nr:unnamed protein product [Amoebophrya sp. A120]|eukprot:GSA120T00011434001.1